MIDREGLTAALSKWDQIILLKEEAPIYFAARERLAQLPKECGYCGGIGGFVDDSGPGWAIGERVCSTCYGGGNEYTTETVDRIVEALRQVQLGNINASFKENRFPRIAVAILDALNKERAT